MNSNELGARIRAARLSKGKSLRATATDLSISPSLLSQVETGKVQPSVSTLYAIVANLEISLDELFETETTKTDPAPEPRPSRPRTPVQRYEDAPEIKMENGVSWSGLAVMDPRGPIDAILATYQPGAASSVDDTFMRHEGVEHGYLISGQLTLKLNFESYVLRPGDSLCFDSTRPHVYVNDGDVPAVGVWFVVGRSPDDSGAASRPVRTVVDALDAISRVNGEAQSAK